MSNSNDSEKDIIKVRHCDNKDFCGPEWDLTIKQLRFEHYSCNGIKCIHYKPLKNLHKQTISHQNMC